MDRSRRRECIAVLALHRIGEAAVALGIDGFRRVDFPAQAVVEGQLRRNAPGVLPVEEVPPLMLRRVKLCADEAVEACHVAKQEGSKIDTANAAGSDCSVSPVFRWLKFNTPVRLASLGTRRLLALRMSAPNLNEWLPQILVQLVTPWNWLSFSTNGQLQRPTFRPSPQLESSVPSPLNAGKPEVNSAWSAP